MATLVLTTVGTLVGGPIGGAIGALLGQEIDGRLLAPRIDGHRLRDLKVSGSSYGDPIPRHYGKTRTAGSIIWATDLKERAEKVGGGKGKPKSTSYSYSISLAVLLASAPIDRIGRIWADGNLLRGAAGDLKTQGRLRIHTGRADQRPDPLMAAALPDRCPAYRGCAYVVFEDLALGDFGNRVPALSFEVMRGDARSLIPALAGEAQARSSVVCPGLVGFSQEGGSIANTLDLIGTVYPMTPTVQGDGLTIAPAAGFAESAVEVDPAAAWGDGDFGKDTGTTRVARSDDPGRHLACLRYYDAARAYQPGLQRSLAGASGVTLEFPGVLDAATARTLVEQARIRSACRRDTMSWRTATLDTRIGPGATVTVPGVDGQWVVTAWELRTGGVELSLARPAAQSRLAAGGDGGHGWQPPDRIPRPTRLRAFEMPWDGFDSPNQRRVYVAASSANGLWSGGVLYARRGTTLGPLADLPTRRAVCGVLAEPLAPSRALRLDRHASITIQLDADADLVSASPEALARGANRARVGREVIQFCVASPQGGGRWTLRGLLRGRGGTEGDAQVPQPAGTAFVLLDDRVVAVPADAALAPDDALAAIGLADAEPAETRIDSYGASLRPPVPVHAAQEIAPGGARTLRWVRRARGAWDWPDEADTPLVEERERYQVGVGPVRSPLASWIVTDPELRLTAADWDELVALYPGMALWVRQCGRFAKSDALSLGLIIQNEDNA